MQFFGFNPDVIHRICHIGYMFTVRKTNNYLNGEECRHSLQCILKHTHIGHDTQHAMFKLKE